MNYLFYTVFHNNIGTYILLCNVQSRYMDRKRSRTGYASISLLHTIQLNISDTVVLNNERVNENNNILLKSCPLTDDSVRFIKPTPKQISRIDESSKRDEKKPNKNNVYIIECSYCQTEKIVLYTYYIYYAFVVNTTLITAFNRLNIFNNNNSMYILLSSALEYYNKIFCR